MDIDPSLAVEIAEGVYPPSEDTFLLLRAIDVRPGERFLEIGTGSGFVALHAAKVAHVVATDLNPAAAKLAKRNATANGLELAVVVCDLFRGLRGTFDVVAFNSPYLVEPIGDDPAGRAWQGGVTGEEVLLRFLAGLSQHLDPKGRAFVLVPEIRERARHAAETRFRAREVARKPLFFEALVVLELRPPG